MAWERLRKHGASTESDSRELWKLTLKMAGKWTRFVVMKKRGFFFFFLVSIAQLGKAQKLELRVKWEAFVLGQ